ncbi:hypothetical protein VOLCADRAFT_120373 [Volvox carteri f. nagariensis]|uniref:Apyrase n=1 Tax=Volvox carteri f. nagariensis TaxID=3068 RepID=D8TJX6_VOLCA|nr:uncharacterized protein VOLCADRAFT_120373 [Volvox carteri f. nagariensis]EFJ51965.1 hypothetical protein VOLCADRAFT_120373 [Volvox carteri f. nagariensis]|eukprot:XP_002946739.1 hypothetical protein VOLCADRAFT_120373 [Volvox carteri f. nagariensis]
MHKSRSSVKISIWSDGDAAAKGSIVKTVKLVNRYLQRLRLAEQWPMGNRRGWLLLCLAATGGLALLILLRAASFIGEGLVQQAQGDQYAVYIDGGSSGTRVRVFRYRPARWPAYVVLVLPEPSRSVEPGLSAYANQPDRAAASLVPLLDFAYEQVPMELWHQTPVRLLATAGLRLLDQQEQEAILGSCQQLLAASRFRFEPSWATVIDGEMEGLFGWAAVNYLTGALQEASAHSHHSRKEVMDPAQLFTGLLEMGGASVQVTFLPPVTAKQAERHGSHLHLPGVPSRLFTHSYLGLGMDSALAQAAEYVLRHQPRSPAISDPCLPIGYVSEDGRIGNGSFAQCMAVVQRIMPEHDCFPSQSAAAAVGSSGGRAEASETGRKITEEGENAASGGYDDDPAVDAHSSSRAGGGSVASVAGEGGGCVLQGSFLPVLSGRFVAVENFAWTARALGLHENATLRQLRESGHHYCAKHWSSLHAEFSGHIPDQFLVRYCFGAAYILALLHSGFGLGLDDGRLWWTNTVREAGEGAEVGLNWVLGAAVVDAMSSSGGVGGGEEHNRGGAAGSQRFWLRDEQGMAAATGSARMVLMLPLAALAALAAFVGLALLRILRSGKARIVTLTPGSGGGAGALFSSRGFGAGSEERARTGGGGRAAGVATSWSSTSLVSEVAAGRSLPGITVRDASSLDPGLGQSPGADVGQRGQGFWYAGMGQGAGASHEGGVAGVKHGGVLKAAALLGSAMRRNPSFTSVLIGVEGLSLDKFAKLGVSQFDKRKKLERIKKQKIIEYSKYKKLKHKLEAQGVLSGAPVKDSVAELEALDFDAPLKSAAGSADEPASHEERIVSHTRAGPSSRPRHGSEPKAQTPAIPDAAEVPGARGPSCGGQRKTEQPGAGVRKRARVDDSVAAQFKQPSRHKGPDSKCADWNAVPDEDGDAMVEYAARSGDKQPAGASAAHRGEQGQVSERQGSREGDNRGVKKLSRLQRLAQRVAEEKAEKQRAKETAMKEREERLKHVAAAEKSRKEQKHLHFKRNAKGQPLMRYRMEKLLSQIQKTV